MTAPRNTYLIRFSGDLSTKKGAAFSRFRSRLAENLRDALRRAELDFDLRLARNRFFLTAPDAAEAILSTTFGIQSWSPVVSSPWRGLDDLVELGASHFGDVVRNRTFAVRVRRSRVRDQVDFSSLDIERELGTRLLDLSAGVDLDSPQITARMELDPGLAHLFWRIEPGPAGLPIGSGGRCLALVSGGIDSAVAAWLMLKRGVEVDYLFFNLGGAEHERQVLEVMRSLVDRWSHGYVPRLRLVDLRPFVAELRERTDERLWQVLLKRAMLHAAGAAAARDDTMALVTGEAIGQVSSQTLANLSAIEAASSLPVLRPLLTYDKAEIVALARRIGTYELSAHIPEYCHLRGRAPATASTEEELVPWEEKLDLAGLAAAVDVSSPIELRALHRDSDSDDEPLAIATVPPDAQVIDLRSPAAFAAWHYPGAVRLDYAEALRACPHFSAETPYVVCCEVEFKSADLAERLRAAGRRAWYFEGGTSALLRQAEAEELADAASVAPAMRH